MPWHKDKLLPVGCDLGQAAAAAARKRVWRNTLPLQLLEHLVRATKKISDQRQEFPESDGMIATAMGMVVLCKMQYASG